MSPLRARLAGGGTTFGAFVTIMAPEVVEVFGTLVPRPLDWVVIDCQHFAHDSGRLAGMIHMGELVGLPVLVRVGRDDLTAAELALDLGAQGIVFPVVNDVDQAARIVGACRYPPEGGRSVGGLRGHLRGDASDGDPVVVLNIEDRAGVDRLDRIAALPGIDLVFPGPVDLARAYGLDPADARVADLGRRIEDVGHAAGAGAMTYCGSPEAVRDAVSRGVECVLLGTDYGLLRDRASDARTAAA